MGLPVAAFQNCAVTELPVRMVLPSGLNAIASSCPVCGMGCPMS